MSTEASVPTEREIRDRLVQEVAAVAEIVREQVDVREPFASYHIPSIEAVHIVAVLESWLGLGLEATLLWDHPTIESLARHLALAVQSR